MTAAIASNAASRARAGRRPDFDPLLSFRISLGRGGEHQKATAAATHKMRQERLFLKQAANASVRPKLDFRSGSAEPLAGPCHLSNSLQGKHSVAALMQSSALAPLGRHGMAQPGIGKRLRWNSCDPMMREKDVF